MGKADGRQMGQAIPGRKNQLMKRYIALFILGMASFLFQFSGRIRGAVCRDPDASLWWLHFMETKVAFEGHWADHMTDWRDGLGWNIDTLTPSCLL